MKIDIPGYKTLELKYLVLDYNGTIAKDGLVKDEIRERLKVLSEVLEIYVLTADTYGTARKECVNLPLKIRTFPKGEATIFKGNMIDELGAENCVSLGNGRNDLVMLEKSELSIGVLDEEGIYAGLINESDILVGSMEAGLDLLIKPNRIIADLRG